MSSKEVENVIQGIQNATICQRASSDSQNEMTNTDRIANSAGLPLTNDLIGKNTPVREDKQTVSRSASIKVRFNELVTKMRSGELKDLTTIKHTIDSIVTQAEDHDASLPKDRSSTIDTLAKLHNLVQQIISFTGDLELLSLDIRCGTRSLDLIPPSDDNRVGWLNNLGNSYWIRFQRQGASNDLDMALDYYFQARALLPPSSNVSNRILHNLGNCYLNRFQFQGASSDIDQAVEYYSQAVLTTPQDDPEMASRLNGLAIALYERFQLRNGLTDLNQAIEHQEKAIEIAKDQDLHMAGWLGNLGNLYQARFEYTGNVEDINESVDLISRAITITPSGHPNLSSLFNNLGDSLRLRHERSSGADDIKRAVEAHNQAVSTTPQGHPRLPGRLITLGESYAVRYQHMGDIEDLQNAMQSHGRALKLTPDGHPNRPVYLAAMGHAYMLQFNRSSGRVSDIDEAVKLFHEALLLVHEEHATIPNLLNSLGSACFQRFKRLNDPSDLDKSIELIEKAVSLVPQAHINLPGLLMNLGNSYSRRFENRSRLGDIDMAVNLQTRAVDLLPENHANRPGVLCNLGNSYRLRYDLSLRNEDIVNAIDCLSKAALSVPDKNIMQPIIMNSLATAYSCRYTHNGDTQDIEEAIKHHSQALLLTPNEHATVPVALSSLGDLYRELYEIRRERAFLEKSLDYYRRSAQDGGFDAPDKFKSVFMWARLASATSRPMNEQMEAYTAAMDLVPQLLLPLIKIEERYKRVGWVGDLALGAAACAIAAHDCDKALEWLEQGRAIVWNDLLKLQNPLDQLALVAPSLAHRLRELSKELHEASFWKPYAPSTLYDSYTLETEAQRCRRLAEERAQLIDQVRQLPGFNTFLRARKSSELVHAARDGPLVMVNIDQMRCDALILTPSHEKIHIPLPNLSYSLINTARKQLIVSLHHHQIQSRGIRVLPAPRQHLEFTTILASLWYNLAKPILDALGYLTQPRAEELPHITWCTTGALSFLPLHAAGDYEQKGARLYNYAISSFTPTLSSLLAPLPESYSVSAQPRLLAVGLEYASGHARLPGTRKELVSIQNQIRSPEHFTRLEDHGATPDNVLSNMANYDWVHLACHAHQNVSDPTSSGFLLHNGTLSLNMIAQKRFRNKGLAFLSACQTATGDEKLPDEATHLAAGMLMAGYTSVIATMWSIMDADAPVIAEKVYSRLYGDHGVSSEHRDISRALHDAVGELRSQVGEESFSRWVPFVHIGI